MYCKNCGKEIKDGSLFCTNCGAKTEENRKPVGETQEDLMRRVIGKNADYYLAQRDRFQRGEKGRMNWASFFLSMLHAGYRNMWKSWLKAVGLPLAVSLLGTTLGSVLLFIQPTVSMVMNVIGGVGSVWLLVAQILYAKKFNRIYLEHVEKKIAGKDEKPDPSAGRAAVVALIVAVIAGILGMLSSAGMMMGLLGGIDTGSEELYADDYSGIDSYSGMDDYSDMDDYSLEGYETQDDFAGTAESQDPYAAAQEESQEPAETVSEPEETYISPNYALWMGDYQRTSGPACSLSIWEADETGILFVANIGYSGADAYVDMREHTAEWVDNSTAIFQEGDNWIVFTYYDGILTVSENPDALYGALSISGVYVLAEEADYPDCEFVFPDSSEFEVMEVSCDGLTAEECRIAKNEIYARHGRMFSDPVLQNYFDFCSWYVPSVAPEDFTEDMLSEVERQSIRGIEAYEGYMGF